MSHYNLKSFISVILFALILQGCNDNKTNDSNNSDIKANLLGQWLADTCYSSHVTFDDDPLSNCTTPWNYKEIIQFSDSNKFFHGTNLHNITDYELIEDTLILEGRKYKIKILNDTLYATFIYEAGDDIIPAYLNSDGKISDLVVAFEAAPDNYVEPIFEKATKRIADSLNKNNIPFTIKFHKTNGIPDNSNELNIQICGKYVGTDNVGMQSSIEIKSNGTFISHSSVGDGRPSYGTWSGTSNNQNIVYISLYQKDDLGNKNLLNRVSITREGLNMNGNVWSRVK